MNAAAFPAPTPPALTAASQPGLRVLMLLSSLQTGGTERNLLAVLPHLRDQGADIVLCTLDARRDGPLADALAHLGIPRIDLGARKLFDLAALRRLLRLVRHERFDVIHAHDQYSAILVGLLPAITGAPAVISRHVLAEPGTSVASRVREGLLCASARFAARRVIAVSEATRQNFIRQAGLHADRVETVYNGVDVDAFGTQARRTAVRASLGWRPNERIITLVAVLRPGKGHEVLFEAAPAIQAAAPEARIKIVGDGPLRDTLEAAAAPLGDLVEFLGERSDVEDILGASDILVLPSWSEALPTVLLEGGAASLPAVATDVGGTREIIRDGVTGFVVPPGAADLLAERTIALLRDPGLATSMGSQARLLVEQRFSLAEQARRILRVYRSAAR